MKRAEPRAVRRAVAALAVLALLAALFPSFAGPAAAQTPPDAGLVSNLGQTRYQYPSYTSWQYEIRLSDHGQRFTTGGNAGGYRVDSVDIELANLSDAATFSKITVMLAGETLTAPAFEATTAPRMYRFTAPAGGIDLLPSTTYTIMIDTTAQPSGSGEVVLTRSTALEDGSASGWTIGQRLNRRWDRGNWSNVSDRIKMRVNGEPSPALVGTLAQPNGQDAPTLVANTGQADGATGSLGDDRAQAFTTGGTGFTLSEVEVLFADYRVSNLSTSVAATIRADSGGSPGSEVGALTVPARAHNTQTNITLMAPAAGISLAANTTYWLEFDSSLTPNPSLPVNIRYTASDAEDADGESGWTIADGSLSRSRSATSWAGATSNAESMKIALIGASFDRDLAQAFTTGGHQLGYTLDSVDVQLSRLDDSSFFTKVAAAIASDSSGSPGASVGTLTTSHSGTFTSDTVVTLAAPAGGISLAANTTYWLVLDVQQALSGINNVRVTSSDAEDAGGLSGWSISNDVHSRNRDNTGGWSSDPATMKIRLNGTAADRSKSFVNDLAQAFTTGSNPAGYTLNSIDVGFASLADSRFASKVSAEIHTNPDHVKRHAVGILTIPSVTGTDFDVTLTAPEGGIRLRPNTTYWLLLDVKVGAPAGDNRVRYTGAAVEDAEWPRAQTGFTVADSSRWKYWHHPRWVTSGDSMNIRIDGTARGPEPPRVFVPVVVGNLGQAEGLASQRAASSITFGALAQTFTTGGSDAGYTLRRVDVEFAQLVDPDLLSRQLTVTVARYSGGNPGAPGATVGTLANPADTTFFSDTVLTFTSSAGIVLDPDTTYWLVLETSGSQDDHFLGPRGGTVVGNTPSDAEDAHAAPGWAIADDFITRNTVLPNQPWSPLTLPPSETPPSLKVRFHASQRPLAVQQAATLFTPGHEALYMREGETRTLGLTLAQELTSGSGAVTVTSSDASVVKVDYPGWLVMGFDRADCPPGGTSSRCLKGRVVQRSEHGSGPSGSMTFGFDERDWAGYTSREPFRWNHRGWREVKVSAERLTTHGPPGTAVDFGADRVFDLAFSHADSSVALPDPVQVVVSRGSGVMDPTFSPDVSELDCRLFDCLTVAEGDSTTYSVTTRFAPRPGRPLRITPTLVEGSGVTFSPAHVEWATVQDYLDNPTKTITVTAADDSVYKKERGIIRHVFNDSWDTNGWLSKALQVPKTYTVDGNTHTFVVSREAAMSQFNMVVRVTDNDPPPVKDGFGFGFRPSDDQGSIGGTGTQDGTLLGYMVAPDVVVKVLGLAGQSEHGPAHVNRWSRVLVAFGVLDGGGVTGGAMTADEAQDMADAHSSPVWDEVVTELTALEAWQASQSQDEQSTPTPAEYTVDPAVVAKVEALAGQTHHGPAHVNRWNRVLVAFGAHDGTGVTDGAITLDEATANSNAYSSPVWDEVVTELTNRAAWEAQQNQDQQREQQQDEQIGQTPELAISAGSGITEGGTASFTITAIPAPASPITVNVGVSQSGSFGASGAATVTVSGASTTYTIATSDDSTDEPDGSVTATLKDGSGYTVSSSGGAATVAVADNDDPPVITPVLTISAGSGITEGGTASFTITATPAPTSPITVNVGVSQSGSFGASGAATVTVSGASTTYTIATSDDSTDEPDGSVTATLKDGSGYTVSSSGGAATVAVADNDDPPVITPVLTISAGSGITEGGTASFTITASPAPTSPITVNVGVSESGSFGASGAATVTVSGTSTRYTIATTDDSTDEPDGTVTATLQDGSGYTVSSSNGAAAVSVADNDDPPPITPEVEITLTVEEASAAESDEYLEFTVRLSQASTEQITIKWNTATAWDVTDNRAHGGKDYEEVFNGKLVFAAGVTEMTATVRLEADGEPDEGDERFEVQAFLPGSFWPADATAIMTITDSD